MTQDERLSQMPETCKGIYKKAMTGKRRGQAVKAFCQECMGYVREEIKLCSDTGCPLYPYRPKGRQKATTIPIVQR